MMVYNMLNIPQKEKLASWVQEQDKRVLRNQKKANHPHYRDMTDGFSQPYYGPIGGSYTYHITPTSLGTVLKVSNTVTEEEIDLTEYENW